MPRIDIVITGLGVVSPLGIGRTAVWEAVCAGKSGVRPLTFPGAEELPVRVGALLEDFDPKRYVANRKSLKVMARDAQIGVAAAALACQDARLIKGQVDPERLGVVLGADRIGGSVADSQAAYVRCMRDGQFDFRRWGSEGLAATFPLSFLMVLPNMTASHVSIAQDARGPNNTIHHAEVSSLLAISEAVQTIHRGQADAMIAGGASSLTQLCDWGRHWTLGRLSRGNDDPAAVLRPFDATRDGEVWGEGGGVMVLESRRHAERRGATVLARVLGCASTFEPVTASRHGIDGLRRAIRVALADAGIQPHEVGYVNAHGASTQEDDRLEAQAIHAELPGVAVTAPKSYFGNLGAAGGAVEAAVSVLGMNAGSGEIPPTLNYRHPDPQCPVDVACNSRPLSAQAVLLINRTPQGQNAAVVLAVPQ